LKNPFSYDYKSYTKLVDDIPFEIDYTLKNDNKIIINEYKIFIKNKNKNIFIKNKVTIDYTKSPEILFIHNGKIYYGNKEIVYGSMKILNDILDICDDTDKIILEGTIPKYIINEYIQSCYTQIFDINFINKEHFIDFLKFIDQYPTSVISIDLIENQIIRFINRYDIPINNMIEYICSRYQLKYLYLYMHTKLNKKIQIDKNIKDTMNIT
jgi:hypothetical protein